MQFENVDGQSPFRGKLQPGNHKPTSGDEGETNKWNKSEKYLQGLHGTVENPLESQHARDASSFIGKKRKKPTETRSLV